MRTYSLIVLAALFVSCQRDKVDFKLLEEVALSPELEIPLVNASLNLGNVVEDDSNFTINPDESISISYHNPNLFSYQAVDLVNIPDQEPVEIQLSTALPVYDLEASLGTIAGMEMQSASFSSGYILMTLQTPAPVTADVEVKLLVKSATRLSQPLESTLRLKTGNTEVSDTMFLDQSLFDFSNGGGAYNHFGLRAEIVDPGNLSASDELLVMSELKNLELQNAQGFFGERAIKIPSGNLLLELDLLEDLIDGIKFTDPSFKLRAISTVGIGVGISPDLKGVNRDGKVTALDTATYILNPAANVNSPEEMLIELNSSNSNVVDFLAAIPHNLLFAGEARLNPGGRTPNFIDKDSEIKVGVDIDVPLEMSIENMKLEKKLEVDFFSENPEEVQSGEIIFRSLNAFPFDLDVSVAILDRDTRDSIHGFHLPLLSTAQVDGTGKVVRPTRSEGVSVEITESMLEALTRSDKMKLVARFNSPNNGQQAVKFFTDNFVDINIAVRAKMKLKP